MDLLLSIPKELLSLIIGLLDVSSMFSLSRTTKTYLSQKVITSNLYFSGLSMFKESLLAALKYFIHIKIIHLDAISNGHYNLFEWLVKAEEVKSIADATYYMNEAAKNGQLDIVQYLNENECQWSREIYTQAAENGRIEILKWLYENRNDRYYWRDLSVCTSAIKGGHLEIVRYLHGRGCVLDEGMFTRAVKYGHLDIVKYLYENKCPWNEWACNYAVEYNHLEVLKYLRENGCPWHDAYCMYHSNQNGNLDMIKYLHENDCRCDQINCNYCNNCK